MILKMQWQSGLSALSLAVLISGTTMAMPLLLARPAFATSDSAEAERNSKFDKKNGVTIKVTNGSAVHGGGGPATTATEIVASQNQQPMLGPQSDAGLKAGQDRYAKIVADGGFPQIPRGSYKSGSKGPGVGALNKHLFMEGYLRVEGTQGEFAELFTNATQEAVSHYQRNMGLAVTGKVDAPTLAELNVTAEERLRTITANVPRLAVYEQGLGDRYLVVNIAAQQLETVSGGVVYSRHNTIVGRPERPSPVVMTPLATVKFNPYWNAPVSIVERDILPKMASGTQVLTDMNMKIFQGGPNGPEVDPKTVKFTPQNIDQYLFRQEPGPKSAMATAKIEFVSPFGIYLHDTPEPELFKTSNRYYSSGCIRVEKMPLLVEWVLNNQGGFNAPKIASMAQTLERLDVPLTTPPQLRVAYLTAWPTAGGTVAFRKDVYGLDGTGFTVGQPMPAGETSPDGLRYVLKPLPRLVDGVSDVGGFSLFGFGKKTSSTDGKSTSSKPKNGFFDQTTSQASSSSSTSKKAKSGAGNKGPGLFDWAAYRKDQVNPTKSASLKHGVKKKKAKPAEVIPPDPTLDASAVGNPVAVKTATKVVKKKKPVCVPASGKDCTAAAVADKPPEKPAN